MIKIFWSKKSRGIKRSAKVDSSKSFYKVQNFLFWKKARDEECYLKGIDTWIAVSKEIAMIWGFPCLQIQAKPAPNE